MINLAPHQTPWLVEALEILENEEGQDWKSVFARALARQAKAHGLRSVVIIAGGDHGYWREERTCEDTNGSCWWEQDTHRGTHKERTAISRKTAMDVFAIASSAVDEPRHLGNIVAFWTSSDERTNIVKSDTASCRITARLWQSEGTVPRR